jgi:hypothetical protein
VSKRIERPTGSRWGGFDYEVQWKPAGSLQVEGDDCYGTTEHITQIIEIEEGLKPERECAILIHEVGHQLAGTAKVNLGGEPDDAEEKACTFFGDALAGHIRDNPDFWRYLIKRLAPRKRPKSIPPQPPQ